MRRRLVLSLLALAGAGTAARAEAPDARGMAVSVVPVQRHCFHDRLAASGTFVARHEVEVRADRDGLVIAEVLVKPGDAVTADQVLARLVSPPVGPAQTGTVKAPIKGTVVAVSAPVGSYASPGAREAMVRIISDDGLDLKADILASRMARVKEGMPAAIHVVGLPGAIVGRVASIGVGVDAGTQAGTVSLSVSDPRLRVGAFARAEIDAGQDCGLLVPLSALLSGPDDGTVVGIVRDDTVEMRKVTLGLLEGGDAEVREGLAENDQVIARAGPFLREGDRVRPVTAAPAAPAKREP